MISCWWVAEVLKWPDEVESGLNRGVVDEPDHNHGSEPTAEDDGNHPVGDDVSIHSIDGVLSHGGVDHIMVHELVLELVPSPGLINDIEVAIGWICVSHY